MRVLSGLFLVGILTVAAAPAEAGKRRPPLVVAVDEGDGKALGKLLKKAKAKDLDAFDEDVRSPTAGLRAIEVAARKGDAAAVDALLAAGATATAKALEYAAKGGQLAIVSHLVDKGAPRADLALTAAGQAGRVEVVAALLPAARKADPYFNLDQVLEFAVVFPEPPSAAVVELLLREKANPALSWGPDQQTVLHLAVRKGAADVVAVLLAAGAPVDAVDVEGYTPFLSALAGGRLGLARALLAAKADPRKVTRRGETALSLLVPLDPAAGDTRALLDLVLGAKVPIDHAAPDGPTALVVAAALGRADWVAVLLGRGASPAAATKEGIQAIDVALRCTVAGSPWGPSTVSSCYPDAALALVAGPRPPLGREDSHQRTTLVRAIMSGNERLVARLLALGMTTGQVDDRGQGPWHYAAQYGTPAIVAALAAAKVGGPAAVSDPDDAGDTPLALARKAGRAGVEQALVAAGAK